MMQIAKRGNGRVSPGDEAKLKIALDNFLKAIFANSRFARLPKLKQRQIAHAVKDFAATEIAARVIYIHSLAEAEQYLREKKNR